MANNRPPLAKSSPNYKGDGPEALLSAIERILKDSGTRNAPSERILKKAPISTIGRLGAEIQGSVFECTKCGGEVTFVSVPKGGQARRSGVCFFNNDCVPRFKVAFHSNSALPIC